MLNRKVTDTVVDILIYYMNTQHATTEQTHTTPPLLTKHEKLAATTEHMHRRSQITNGEYDRFLSSKPQNQNIKGSVV